MWEAENICLLAQGVYFKAVTAILSITLISREKVLHQLNRYMYMWSTPPYHPCPPRQLSDIPVTKHTTSHEAKLLRRPPLQHQGQMLQVVPVAQSAELPVKVIHTSYFKKINLQLSTGAFSCTGTLAVTTNSVCFVKKE